MTKDDLSRRFLLDITADGTVCCVRERGGSPCPHGGLVFFSVDTREDAKALKVRHCRLARDGSGAYRVNDFQSSLVGLDETSAMFRASYASVNDPGLKAGAL